jgi:hypothetical protein
MQHATSALMGLLGWGLGWGLGCLVAGWLGVPPTCACQLSKSFVVLAACLLTAGGAGH